MAFSSRRHNISCHAHCQEPLHGDASVVTLGQELLIGEVLGFRCRVDSDRGESPFRGSWFAQGGGENDEEMEFGGEIW
jgi:hypothetical protein